MEQPVGIIRVFRADVSPDNEAEWYALQKRQVAEQLRGVDGFLSSHIGRSTRYESDEHIVATLWRDRDAMRAWTGASETPMIFENDAELGGNIRVEVFELEPL